MIKNAFKTLLKCIEYYFTPVGIIAFVVLLTMGIVVPRMINCCGVAFNQIATIVGEGNIDLDALQSFLINEIMDASTSGSTNFYTVENLIDVFARGVQAATGIQELGQDVLAIIDSLAGQIVGYVVLIAIFAFIGVFLSFVLVLLLIRRRVNECSYLYSLLVSVIEGAIFVGMAILVAYLIRIDSNLSLAIGIVATVIFIFTSIFFSYLFFGRKKIPFRRIFSLKAYLSYALSSVLFIGVGVGLWFGLTNVLDDFVFYIIMVPLIDVLFCAVILNGEVTINYLVEAEKKKEIKTDK